METVLENPEEMSPITLTGPVNNDTIFDLLLKEEDLTWQTLLHELVRTEQMDPWDIDIKVLTKKFISMVKKLKEIDFRISGKIVLAAAILLKIKSNKLLLDDISAFDNLLRNDPEEMMDELYSEEGDYEESYESIVESKPKIFPRTPQPRKRKVSIFDLVDALEKALDTKNKRKAVPKLVVPKVHTPTNHKDISLVIGETYELLKDLAKEHDMTTFSFNDLLPSEEKEDKIYTFIPLLHLTNQRKIDMEQEYHFGDIDIHLLEQKPEEAIAKVEE